MTRTINSDDIAYIQQMIENAVQTAALGIEITDLNLADSMRAGDLMMIRNTSNQTDKALSYQNLMKSIGNTAVDGFNAEKDDTLSNSIILHSVNGVFVDQYYEGMKVAFKSPLKSTGQVQIKIGSLTYKNLFAYKSTTTAVIDEGDWVEAVLINGIFYQTNNAQYVYTNDYVVETYEVGVGGQYTNIFLSSAFGVLKTTYYVGMTINFTCPIDTQGFIRVNIDGLGVIDVTYGVDNLIPLALYEGQMVQAVFDGEAFKPNKFEIQNPKVQIPVKPDPVKPDQPLIPPQNKLEFTVGTGGKFTDLTTAIETVVKEYGQNGGGRKVTLSILSTQTTPTSSGFISALTNLDWITLSSPNNIINLHVHTDGPIGELVLFGANGNKICKIAPGTTINISSNREGAVIYLFNDPNLELSDLIINFPESCKCKLIYYYNVNRNIYYQNVNLNNVKITNLYNMMIYNGNSVINNCILETRLNSSILHVSHGGQLILTKTSLTSNPTGGLIYIDQGGIVTQINSKAKANLAPNTIGLAGTYRVTGSQDVVGT